MARQRIFRMCCLTLTNFRSVGWRNSTLNCRTAIRRRRLGKCCSRFLRVRRVGEIRRREIVDERCVVADHSRVKLVSKLDNPKGVTFYGFWTLGGTGYTVGRTLLRGETASKPKTAPVERVRVLPRRFRIVSGPPGIAPRPVTVEGRGVIAAPVRRRTKRIDQPTTDAALHPRGAAAEPACCETGQWGADRRAPATRRGGRERWVTGSGWDFQDRCPGSRRR